MNPFTAKWPPWIGGVLLALLLVAALALFDDPVGLAGGMIALTEYADTAAHGRIADAPSMDWQVAMLFGIFFGAMAGAIGSGEFKLEFLDEGGPTAGTRIVRTILSGIAGGALLMLGVQLAGETVWGECAAAIQLAGGGWTFLAGLLLSGCLLAILFERRGEGGGRKNRKRGNK